MGGKPALPNLHTLKQEDMVVTPTMASIKAYYRAMLAANLGGDSLVLDNEINHLSSLSVQSDANSLTFGFEPIRVERIVGIERDEEFLPRHAPHRPEV